MHSTKTSQRRFAHCNQADINPYLLFSFSKVSKQRRKSFMETLVPFGNIIGEYRAFKILGVELCFLIDRGF